MLRTAAGFIALTVPPQFSAELDASTSDGHLDNHLELKPGKVTSNRAGGTPADGGHLVLVRTGDGRIRLDSR